MLPAFSPRLPLSPSPRRLLAALITLSVTVTVTSFAQTPPSPSTSAPASTPASVAPTTPPPKPPPKIPAEGITLTAADRAELTAGVATLRAEIDALARDLASDARLLALLPDVEIFHKAVAWSLADDTFYSPREVTFAKHLLVEGRERAAQLRAKTTPWLDLTPSPASADPATPAKPRVIVRGYRSKIDGSVQPYGLSLPADLDLSKPLPTMVWLLGRGEKRTELAFLAEREGGPSGLTPKATLAVIPYGRFCNATKFAGEVDVMEALAAVRAQYKVDPLRIAVAGFSMGGGSTWHLAPHYSGLWCAASPGAGFAETPIFTKAVAPGKEVRPAWEQLLWRQYESTGISGNFSNVPTLAYAGEIDGQKEASDLMEAAMAKEGLKLERFIGPKTGHAYQPETKVALTKRFEELIAQGRNALPREVWLQTYTLRYPESAWVRIEGMGRHWELAEVRATQHDHKIEARTKNVTALSFPGITDGATVVIDGDRLELPLLNRDGIVIRGMAVHFERKDAKWELVTPTEESSYHPPALRKSPGLTGPIDDAFVDAFTFVRPTGKPLNPELGTWVENELTYAAHLWRDVYRGDAPVIADTALTDADIANKNLILWGDPTSNKVLAKLLATGKLPLTWDGKSLTFRGKTYASANHAPILIFPNPLNPAHYVVVNSGLDFRADGYGNNALQTPKLPDWAIVDLRTPPGPRWPGKVVDAGFFDESWK